MKIAFLVSVLLSLPLLSGCSVLSSKEPPLRAPAALGSDHLCKNLERLKIHSHRGAWDRPENMLTAFQRAVGQGADFIEMDLQISKDNEVIVAHDVWMKSECNDKDGTPVLSKIYYRNMNLSEIKEYDCGSRVRVGEAVKGERISTLHEVLSVLKDRKSLKRKTLQFNIEIKYSPSQPDYYPPRDVYVDRVLDAIDRSGVSPDQIMIQSFDVEILKVVRQKRSKFKLSPLLSDVKGGVAIALDLGANMITPHYSQVTPEMLRDFQSRGIEVVPWTVNNPESAKKLIDWGVDGIITDYPEWFTFTSDICSPGV